MALKIPEAVLAFFALLLSFGVVQYFMPAFQVASTAFWAVAVFASFIAGSIVAMIPGKYFDVLVGVPVAVVLSVLAFGIAGIPVTFNLMGSFVAGAVAIVLSMAGQKFM